MGEFIFISSENYANENLIGYPLFVRHPYGYDQMLYASSYRCTSKTNFFFFLSFVFFVNDQISFQIGKY